MEIDVFMLGDIYQIEHPNDFNGYVAMYKFSKINTKEVYYWIADEAIVIGNAKVMDDAIVKRHALVREEAVISGQVVITDNAAVYGNAHISGRSRILGSGTVSGDTTVAGASVVRGHVTGDTSVENSYINANTIISGGSILRNFEHAPSGKYSMYASELRDIRNSKYLMAEEQDIISAAEIFFKNLEEALRKKGLSDTDILDVILQYYTNIKGIISYKLKERFNKES